MRVETAIKAIDQECEFLGIKFDICMAEIEQFGARMFSQRTVEAYKTLIDSGYKLGNTVIV